MSGRMMTRSSLSHHHPHHHNIIPPTLWLVLLMILSICNCLPIRLEFDDEDMLDLTYPFNNQTVYYPTMEQLGFTFQLGTVFRGLNKQQHYYSAYWFQAAEHGGTHVDAPSHNQINGTSVDRLPLGQLIGPVIVLDISQKAKRNVDYLITVEDLQQWEEKHGKMPKGGILLICSGWGQKWPNRNALFGTKNFPDDTSFHFPGLAPPAAKWLIKHRSLKAVGTDGPSVDSGPNQRQLPVHQLFSAAHVLIIEFVANVEKLPTVGATVIGLPMKIEGGSAAPLRLIGVNWRQRPTGGVTVDAEEEEEGGEGEEGRKNIASGVGSRRKHPSLNTSASSRPRPSSNVTATVVTRPTAAPMPRKISQKLKIPNNRAVINLRWNSGLPLFIIFPFLSLRLFRYAQL
ncbi:hypothetical protein BV898_03348 [Hypsibius exemplaris]|uniref:Kynurenine formamidase n=1 Tax=Hypsibius exemplaris TaxID=2072580 RepID=A0A1W0X6H9_HYPEX|nr:hypothetical protein BV898_03348 [Hypsibius exemplaris]